MEPRAAPRASETLPTPGAKKGMSDGPSFKPDLLGSETVTILCRPIREVRVGRPRVRRDRLGAHASAEGLMRRLVDASRVRIPVPVRSRPRWSRRIPTRIAHGIGHDYAWVFMDSIGNKAVNPKLAESAPNPTDPRHRRQAPDSRHISQRTPGECGSRRGRTANRRNSSRSPHRNALRSSPRRPRWAAPPLRLHENHPDRVVGDSVFNMRLASSTSASWYRSRECIPKLSSRQILHSMPSTLTEAGAPSSRR